MKEQQFTKPYYFFFLVLPFGISIGFATVTLPYLLTQHGFTVAQSASIVAIGFSANVWRFLWGPLADLSLTLRKWYWIGVIACVSTLVLLSVITYSVKNATLITFILFLSQVAATFVVLPLGGLMAHRIEETKKGLASGWYQAGNLGGMGFGGGAGLWLASHFNASIAGIVLGISSLMVGLFIFRITDVQRTKAATIGVELKNMGSSLLAIVRVPIVLFILIMFLMPIATGAASNLWSSIAQDWKTNADTVALVTGVLSGVIGAIGCVIGGWVADKFGNWFAFFSAGSICALVTAIMAILPCTPVVYIVGVLFYAFALGLANAVYTSLALYASGKTSASTKYALLLSLANIPVVYMTAIDGWIHDKYNSKFMLLLEALAGIIFIIIVYLVLRWLMAKSLVLQEIP